MLFSRDKPLSQRILKNRFLQSAVDSARSTEQRRVLHFEIDINAPKTITFIKLAFEYVSRSSCVTFEWFKRLNEGRISIKGDHRLGRPSTPKKKIVSFL